MKTEMMSKNKVEHLNFPDFLDCSDIYVFFFNGNATWEYSIFPLSESLPYNAIFECILIADSSFNAINRNLFSMSFHCTR